MGSSSMYKEQQKKQKVVEKVLKMSLKPLLTYEKARGEALAVYQTYHDEMFPGWLRNLQELEEARLKQLHDGLSIYAKALTEKAQVFSEQATKYSDIVGLLNVVTEVNSFIVKNIENDRERQPPEKFPVPIPATSEDVQNSTWELVCSADLEDAKHKRALSNSPSQSVLQVAQASSRKLASVSEDSAIPATQTGNTGRNSHSSRTISIPSDSDTSNSSASPITSGEFAPRTKPPTPRSPVAVSGADPLRLLPESATDGVEQVPVPPPVPDVPDDFFNDSPPSSPPRAPSELVNA